ncbi:putative serine threonine-protein kinase [Acanthamoeba polyphaga mimivirus]|uniref:Serine threonine-protein kinase n=1 Tax=Acanthamoeba polyphaga mimivirus Kroon TaxID=3069720 RepID=A0A0G2YB01_9VIRU|nr:putative serine threonine-protein kinase [Acanthamoeba polyphaga mimivirus]AKI80251.1 putative serine threonine-protein kinase [Acanthamoeba polyphaga mimivirus Kroon]
MEIINNRYKMSDTVLGKGGFSEVFLGTDMYTDNKVAIKKINITGKNSSDIKFLNKLDFEIRTMQILNHPNIVAYHDVMKTENYWYIVMEYCNFGTLNDVIKFNKNKGISSSDLEKNTYYYLNQLRDALNYIINMGYIHRDIKPMNILLTKSTNHDNENSENINYDRSNSLILKLADFGLTKKCSENEEDIMNTICGSPLYMAPELFFNQHYNSQSDIWSFGIIMYQLLFHEHPINATNYSQLKNGLKNQKINFPKNNMFSNYCFDLLSKTLAKDPKDRLNWSELFHHYWFIHWSKQCCPENNSNDSDNKKISDKSQFNEILSGTKSPLISLRQFGQLGQSNLSKFKNNGTINCSIDFPKHTNNFPSAVNQSSKIGSSNSSNPINIPVRNNSSKKINYDDIELISNGNIFPETLYGSISPVDSIINKETRNKTNNPSSLNLSEFVLSDYEI